MALGTNHNSATTLAPFVPEKWGQKINEYFKAALKMSKFFTDRSEEVADGGDTIHTPNITAMSANDKTPGSQVTLNNSTENGVDLVISTHKEVSFLIEDKEVAQYKKSYTLQKTKAEQAGYEAAACLEVAIAKLFAGFSQSVGASTTSLADSEIRQAIAYMFNANVTGLTQDGTNAQDVRFFFHPNTFWLQVQAIDRFALAVNSPVNDPTGKVPMYALYGIPLDLSTNIQYVASTTGRENALAHRDAIHFAKAALPQTPYSVIGTEGVRVQTSYVHEYLGWLTTADILFGVIENRDNAGIRILTKA
jgi:hypothetical protein